MAHHNTTATNDIPGTIPVPPQIAQELQKRVAFILDSGNPSRFPGAQPVSFLQQNLNDLKAEDFFVSEKADGTRYLLLVCRQANNQQECFLIDRKNHYHFVPNLCFPRDQTAPLDNTIMDGELVVDRVSESGQEQRRFLVFDLLALEGQSVIGKPFTSRLGRLTEFVLKPFHQRQKMFGNQLPPVPFTVELKHMERSYALNRVLDEIIPKLKHGNDGLIFTSAVAPYAFGTCDKMLKWKPPNLNSIDFKVRVIMNDGNQPRFMLDIGRTNREYESYGELVLSPDDPNYATFMANPIAIHGRIAECTYDPSLPTKWRLMRFRDDKDQPNHESVVPKIMRSIEEGVSEQELKNAEYLQQVRALWKEREVKPNQ